MEKITLTPIGIVKNNTHKTRFGSFKNEVSEIVLKKKFTKALTGIEDYSHLIIVFWMDKMKDKVITHRPQGNPDVPIVGIFSCRCPQRPNPIAVTTVKLLSRKGNKLKVKGLDILNKTPIIDIKPYWPVYDEVKRAKIPKWVSKLDL
ncbi:tRNA (N6-threonylcarbamoyladenosine(37)-N6)-methyltransferase TrmO [Patescibacteria group bacterium]|nr:tRNA (N6-threonylcarbamoyladenosine(37)-N6)-methyltransferase TrmO [Patescibacteria group bacterium]